MSGGGDFGGGWSACFQKAVAKTGPLKGDARTGHAEPDQPPTLTPEPGRTKLALVLPPPLGGFQLSTAGLADLFRITITPPEDNEIWAFDI